MLAGFKQFVLRGNVVDMAVGVVIGAAFGGVTALITPLIAALVGKPDFSAISFSVGDFINAVVSFLLMAAAIYFFVVTPVNALVSRMRKAPAPTDPTTKKCPECLSEIPMDLRGWVGRLAIRPLFFLVLEYRAKCNTESKPCSSRGGARE